MNQQEYIRSRFTEPDDALQGILKSIEEAGMPTISVPPEVGKLITLLVKISGAKKALEVGALGGYSGVHILKGLPEDGHLTSLELNPDFAELAKNNLLKAGFNESQFSHRIGQALDSFEELSAEGRNFDFFLIDADKRNYKNYLESAVELSNPGAVICADNTLWRGRVYDFDDNDKITVTIREFNETVARHPRLESMMIPLGDGLLVARVKG